MTEAKMWTDSRYYLAAEKELYEDWSMMKMESDSVKYFEWIKNTLPKQAKVGVDND